ncbi:hypothetical LOC301124, isoform CRA_c [Rattus norvegicus]|nr:hypothetical LOC301124, isoform CRA_c [Rattus norvegicus]
MDATLPPSIMGVKTKMPQTSQRGPHSLQSFQHCWPNKGHGMVSNLLFFWEDVGWVLAPGRLLYGRSPDQQGSLCSRCNVWSPERIFSFYKHFFFFFFRSWGLNPGPWRLLGKRSTTELNPQPRIFSF